MAKNDKANAVAVPPVDEIPEHEPEEVTPTPTTTCHFCGAEKPIPATPGQEQPDEFCPSCGKGEPAS